MIYSNKDPTIFHKRLYKKLGKKNNEKCDVPNYIS